MRPTRLLRLSVNVGFRCSSTMRWQDKMILSTEDLAHALKNSKEVKPVCASWFMPNDPQNRTGRAEFEQDRLPGARFFDLDAVKDPASPYPHMLPTAEGFANAMDEMRILPTDSVMIYDSHQIGLFSAPRVAWTFRVFGHEKVHLLDSFKLWKLQDRHWNNEVADQQSNNELAGGLRPSLTDIAYPIPQKKTSMIASFEEVKDVVDELATQGNARAQIIDARSSGRWAGTAPEPRPGLPSGHMPGSINLPFSELLDPRAGTLLEPQVLRTIFASKKVDPSRPIICSCGTGVTAAIIEAALIHAEWGDQSMRRIYDGSWTEWAQRVPDDPQYILRS